MSKVLRSTCEAGVVKFGTTTIPEARVLSKGLGPSTGVTIHQDERVDYLTSNATDLEETIDAAIDAAEAAADGISAVGGALGSIAGATGDLGAIAAAAAASAGASAAASALGDVASALAELKARLK